MQPGSMFPASNLRLVSRTIPLSNTCRFDSGYIELAFSNQPYWTLTEASAWVVFRDASVVDFFAPLQPADWTAYMMYPAYWETKKVGEQLELFAALTDGRLVGTARTAGPNAARVIVPTPEWSDLAPDVRGPYLRLPDGTKVEPWRDVLVRRADVERLWRRTTEVDGRSRFSKDWFQERYVQLKKAKPASSKNELIEELQEQFQEETRREAPSRSSLQNYLKGL